MSVTSASLAVDCRCILGEGIVWCERREVLLWTDIQASRLWMHHPATGATRTWELPDRLGSMALCESGKLLLGLAKGLFLADLDASPGPTLAVSPLVEVEAHQPQTRVNDGRTDRKGNFVFGTFNEDADKAPIGSFYQYSSRHGLRRLALGGVSIPNSICFSADGGTMYYCESLLARIMRCDYDADAAQVAGARLFAAIDDVPGEPDGSVMDADGYLWNAQWGVSRVARYDPDGRLERTVAIPTKHPSCVVFGGPGLGELYITTARQGMTAQDLECMPQSGGVFHAAIGDVRGLADPRFNDR